LCAGVVTELRFAIPVAFDTQTVRDRPLCSGDDSQLIRIF